VLSQGCEQLTKQQQTDVENKLIQLLTSIQAGNNFRSFGQCTTCIHNRKTSDGFLCGLTQETLSIDDTLLICREHELSA